MKRILSVVAVGLFAGMLGLSGCQEGGEYSSQVQYGVRNDPLMVATQLGDLGEDQYEPDRPGVLPIMHINDALHPDNPLSAKGTELFTKPELVDPTAIAADDRKKMDDVLTELFGTPSAPKVAELDSEARAKLKLDDETLKKGVHYYRIHCVHCHGVPGDGRGPTARWINPHPRDFRQGLFKFMSVNQARGQTELPPRRQDLLYTLQHGIEGTAMPSFVILGNDDLNYLASYVIHLSMRGRAEYDTMRFSFDWKYGNGGFTATYKEEASIADTVKDWHTRNVKKWMDSQNEDNWIKPAPDYFAKRTKKAEKDDKGEWQVWESIKDGDADRVRGAIAAALFNNEEPTDPQAKKILALRGDQPKNANCKQCHLDYGRQSKFKFDAWATLTRPNNFSLGIFRGGRRPVDIYHRVHSGINGTPMTPFGNVMTSNSLWDLVHFVRSLSYPSMRRNMGVELD